MTESLGSGNSTRPGYMVQWRLKPGSEALIAMLTYNDVRIEWGQANYSVHQICLEQQLFERENKRPCRPFIEEADAGLSRYGLVRKPVAEAILACLKSGTKRKMLEHIEWRIVMVRLKEEYSMEMIEKLDPATEAGEEMRDMIKDQR